MPEGQDLARGTLRQNPKETTHIRNTTEQKPSAVAFGLAKFFKNQAATDASETQVQQHGTMFHDPDSRLQSPWPLASEPLSSQKFYAPLAPPPPPSPSQVPAYRNPATSSFKNSRRDDDIGPRPPPLSEHPAFRYAAMISSKNSTRDNDNVASDTSQPTNRAMHNNKMLPLDHNSYKPALPPVSSLPTSRTSPRKSPPTKQTLEQAYSPTIRYGEAQLRRALTTTHQDHARPNVAVKGYHDSTSRERFSEDATGSDSDHVRAMWRDYKSSKDKHSRQNILGASPPLSIKSNRSQGVSSQSSKSSKVSFSSFFKKLMPESSHESSHPSSRGHNIINPEDRPDTASSATSWHSQVRGRGKGVPPTETKAQRRQNLLKASISGPVSERRKVDEYWPDRRKAELSRPSDSREIRQTTFGDFLKAGLGIHTERSEHSQHAKFRMPGIRRKSSEESLDFKCIGLPDDRSQIKAHRRLAEDPKHCKNCGAREVQGYEFVFNLCPPCYTDESLSKRTPDTTEKDSIEPDVK